MEPFEYLLLQLELEGIQRRGDRLMRRIRADVDDFPLVILACTSDGQQLICLDERLPAALRGRLNKTGLRSFQTNAAVEILERTGLAVTACQFKTYRFPDGGISEDAEDIRCLSLGDPRLAEFGFSSLAGNAFAAECDGAILSACVSSRQNEKCAEAWVITSRQHRQKGLGRRVVQAWARHLQGRGITPLYSHDVRNASSALLAKSLGLELVFTEAVIEEAC